MTALEHNTVSKTSCADQKIIFIRENI